MKFQNPTKCCDEGCKVIYGSRDPDERDIHSGYVLWISKEYVPNRIFQGKEGKWIFVGKFYPEEKE